MLVELRSDVTAVELCELFAAAVSSTAAPSPAAAVDASCWSDCVAVTSTEVTSSDFASSSRALALSCFTGLLQNSLIFCEIEEADFVCLFLGGRRDD